MLSPKASNEYSNMWVEKIFVVAEGKERYTKVKSFNCAVVVCAPKDSPTSLCFVWRIVREDAVFAEVSSLVFFVGTAFWGITHPRSDVACAELRPWY